MKEQDIKFMNEALKEAHSGLTEDEVPIGAIIVHKGKVIARAHNLVETLNDATAHAEMQAITIAGNHIGGKYLKDCTIYVTIEPCPMCAAALSWSQIGRIVYGANDPKRGCSLFFPSLIHPKTEVVGGVLEEECGTILSGFFSSKR